MRFVKNMTITMTFSDSLDLFNNDIQSTILANFNKMYAGKCYGGSLIEMGREVLNYGLITCNDDGKGGYVPVEIRCDVINYEKEEIIIAKVKKMDENGTIYTNTEHAMIVILPSKGTIGVKVNDEIPIRINESFYSLYKKISSGGEMINIKKVPTRFVIVPDGPDSEISEMQFSDSIDSFLHEISELSSEIDKLAKETPKAVNFIRSKVHKLADGTHFKVDTIRNIKPGMIVSRGNHYGMSYCVYNGRIGSECPGKMRPIVLMLLAYVKIDLINLINLVKNYEAIKDLDFIWKTYQ